MLEKRIASLDYPGFEAELAALRNMLKDVDRIADLESGIADLETKVEQARLERERRKEERAARKAEEDRKASIRRHLEERLKEWDSFGLNIETLKTALESDPVIAEKKFEEFENSLYRTEELRLQLHEFQARVGGNLPGAESVERLLKDPLRLPQAERAFAELRQRAEETLRSLDTDFQSVVKRVAELKEKGEDVAELERALKRSPADAKKALKEHEQRIRQRELQDTWKGIMNRVVSAGGAQPEGTAAPAAAGGGAGGTIMTVLQVREPPESVAQEQPGGGEGPEGPNGTAHPQEAAPALGKIVKKKRKKLTKAGE